MTRVLGAFLLAMMLAPGSARAGELTLRDVIELHRAGLGEALLVAVIEADGGPFKLSYAEILDLKADGLSERVITALVRTGRRNAPPAEAANYMVEPVTEAAPSVIVEQEVTQVAPTVVVLGGTTGYDDDRNRHRRRDRDGHDDRQRSAPPPAAWVTRSQDGRNVSSGGGVVNSGKPPATWVTPNDIRTAPKGFHPGNQETPRRGEDRGSRNDDRRDDDRRDDRGGSGRPKP